MPATERLPWETLLGACWQQHGVEILNTRCFLSSFCDKFCHNIDIKYSGYRAKEWETYFYGLGPGLLQSHLPPTYFQHYLKIVYCIRALHQRSISQNLLNSTEKLIIEFVLEFEDIYYQNDIKRLHFCRPSLHKLLHLCEQTRLTCMAFYLHYSMDFGA
ncbi:hypothetical protein BT69DRAFT_1391109 [Atractiella rhizophila]|nr:hypothetical protein BT69DRAFT_1391109 [Atractiella rhizophila]